MNALLRARQAWQDADDRWSHELQRQFGTRAGDLRYVTDGQGAPGSALRKAYGAFQAAGEAYRALAATATDSMIKDRIAPTDDQIVALSA